MIRNPITASQNIHPYIKDRKLKHLTKIQYYITSPLLFNCALCVNSCKVYKTAAHHGGEEGRILTVPIHCFIWAIWRQNSWRRQMLSVHYWDGNHFYLNTTCIICEVVHEDHLFQRWCDQQVAGHWAVSKSWPHEDRGHWTPQHPTLPGALCGTRQTWGMWPLLKLCRWFSNAFYGSDHKRAVWKKILTILRMAVITNTHTM